MDKSCQASTISLQRNHANIAQFHLTQLEIDLRHYDFHVEGKIVHNEPNLT